MLSLYCCVFYKNTPWLPESYLVSLQGSNVPSMDLLGITNNVVLERLEFGKYINQMAIILYQFVAKTSTAILVLLLAIASELVSFHVFVYLLSILSGCFILS